MNDIIKVVFDASDSIKNNRTLSGVFYSLSEEVGELATELGIECGHINKTPGPDGILGESIDIIVCVLDLIRIKYPNVTAGQLSNIAFNKCEKWKDSIDKTKKDVV